MSGWIGVDFDGTLSTYVTWCGPSHCGTPIPAMVERVRHWRAEGLEVRIFTARIHPLDRCVGAGDPLPVVSDGDVLVSPARAAVEAVSAIRAWCLKHIGEVLPITNVKDYGMLELYDDRAVQVRMNTGEIVGSSTRGLV